MIKYVYGSSISCNVILAYFQFMDYVMGKNWVENLHLTNNEKIKFLPCCW
jgi:hypothetical protein